MSDSQKNKETKEQEATAELFKRPASLIMDEKQWMFLKKRYHMTPRELQVAILVCRGFNNNEIASSLKMKHGTVKTHLRNIYRRVRVKSKIMLLLKFVEDVNKYYPEGEKSSVPIEEKKSQEVTEKLPTNS